MDRCAVEGFFDELDKISALYDPAIHNTPQALERLRRMEELQLKHRVRTSGIPITRFGLRDIPGMLKKDPSILPVMAGGYFTAPEVSHAGNIQGRVYAPKGIAEKIVPATAAIRPGPSSRMARSVVMHHELDEAKELARKVKKHSLEGLQKGFTWGPSVAEQQKSQIPKRLRGPATKLYRKGVETLPAKGREALDQFASIRAQPTAMHMDPRILIQESNRVSRLDPASRKKMLSLRKGSGEAELMRRHGLRYGEEAVPESGKRLEKLRAAMSKEQVVSEEKRLGMAKTVKRGVPKLKRIVEEQVRRLRRAPLRTLRKLIPFR